MESPVVILNKRLTEAEPATPIPGVSLVTYSPGMEIDWVELHRTVFAESPFPVRTPSVEEFLQNQVRQPSWKPSWIWFAQEQSTKKVIGSVRLQLSTIYPRNQPAKQFASVDWLMVDKSWRTRGIGRLLMRTLEFACWNESAVREIRVTCHRKWKEAVAFCKALGYSEI